MVAFLKSYTQYNNSFKNNVVIMYCVFYNLKNLTFYVK